MPDKNHNLLIKFRFAVCDASDTFLYWDYWGWSVDDGVMDVVPPPCDRGAEHTRQYRWTGFKDRCGKEIYEGSKVIDFKNVRWTGVVVYLPDTASFYIYSQSGMFPLDKTMLESIEVDE